MNSKFTPEEDQFIIDHQGKLTYGAIAEQIGRPSGCSIGQRIKVLERMGKLNCIRGYVRNGVLHRRYSEKEKAIIKKSYPNQDIGVLIEELKRSKASLRYQAGRLNVKKNPPPYFNAGRIAKLLGVRQRTALDWIHRGYLKGSQTGRRGGSLWREWKIEPEDFTNFIRDYYFVFDPTRIKDKSLLSVLKTTLAARAIPICQAIKVLGMPKSTLTKRINQGKIPAYKGFGPGGHPRWYVQLDGATFDWFLNSVDERAAEWLTDTAYRQDHDSVELLNILVRCEPERVKEIRQFIRQRAPRADQLVREFEKTPPGERLRNLIN